MKFKIIVLLSLFVVSNSHTIDHSFIEQLATISDDTPEAPKLEMQVELAKDEADVQKNLNNAQQDEQKTTKFELGS